MTEQTVSVSRSTSLRSKLLTTFLLAVLLPVLVLGAVLTISNTQGTRLQIVEQYRSVASYKEQQIVNWLSALQRELRQILLGEAERQALDVVLQPAADVAEVQAAQEHLRGYLAKVMERNQVYNELFILDASGTIVVSTNRASEGAVKTNEDYFIEGQKGDFVSPLTFAFSLGGQRLLIASRPIRDFDGRTMGVLAARIDLAELDALLLDRTGIGQTGKAYLVSQIGTDARLVNVTGFARVGDQIETPLILQALSKHTDGDGSYTNFLGNAVIGAYRWLDDLQVLLVAEQDVAESYAGAYASLAVYISVALAALVVAVFVSLAVTRSIAGPVADLSSVAAQIAAGDIHLRAEVVTEDDIGELASAFNTMTAQLQALITGLEQRVEERTRDLERRSAYLKASTDVSYVVSSILSPEQLEQEVVELIRERFGMYYVGLFVVDQSNEWAVLRAGTGEAGKAMLARGHRIRVGSGMVGWSVANARARVASDAGQDAVRVATAELPLTRSEAALPLRSRGRVLGALSVQSTQPDAFDAATIAVLQVMADQVATALDNASLYMQSQEALETARRVYGEASRTAWQRLLARRSDLSFLMDETGAIRIERSWKPEMIHAFKQRQLVQGKPGDPNETTLAAPILVRDQPVGVLYARKPQAAGPWTDEETALVQTIVAQVGIALEGAQLYLDSQRRAERERLVAEVTSRMRETLNVDAILQTAVEEIGQSLGLADLVIELKRE